MDTVELLVSGTVARVSKPSTFKQDDGSERTTQDVHIFSGITPVKVRFPEDALSAIPAEGDTVHLWVAVRAYEFRNKVGLSVRYLRPAGRSVVSALAAA